MRARRAIAALAAIPMAATVAVSLVWAAANGFTALRTSRVNYVSISFFPVTSPQLAVDRSRNLISMGAVEDVHLTVLCGPRRHLMTFRVRLLTNPEIRVVKGARVILNIENMDHLHAHDLDITPQPPPYTRTNVEATDIGTGKLAAYNGKRYEGADLILKATNPGTYYYVSTLPGQAQAGMWGKIVILP